MAMSTLVLVVKALCLCIAVSRALKLEDEASLINRQALLLDKPSDIDQACACGRMNKLKLISGVPTNPNSKYSFMAVIKENGTYRCVGTLISDQFVMTAASCVKDSQPLQTTVQLGVNSITAGSASKFTTVGVNRFIIHGSFNRSKPISPFDIALVRLRDKVPIRDFIPICLPLAGEIFLNDGLEGKTVSWATNSTTSTSGIVQELSTTAMSTYNCQGTTYNASIVQEMMCVKNSTGGSGLQVKDYGAPFLVERKKSYLQMGLAFHQNGNKLPGIYTNLRMFVKWIYGKTTHSRFCKNPIGRY